MRYRSFNITGSRQHGYIAKRGTDVAGPYRTIAAAMRDVEAFNRGDDELADIELQRDLDSDAIADGFAI